MHTDVSCLVGASSDHALRLWDVASGRIRHTLTGHSDKVAGLCFSLQVKFCRYRFCATGELKYRGAVGLGYRSTYKRTLYIIFLLLIKLYGFAKLKAKVAD
jgi:WD40 repeat protein